MPPRCNCPCHHVNIGINVPVQVQLRRGERLRFGQTAASWDRLSKCTPSHKALGNVTPADVLHGRRDEILLCRREAQLLSISRRRVYNTGSREPLSAT